MVDTLSIYERYFPDRITPQGFEGHMLLYIQQLLSDNAPAAKIDEYLEKYGLTSEKVLKELLDNRILKRTEKIKTGSDGKDVFCVKYEPCYKDINYHKVLRNLYIKLFENYRVDNDMYLKETTSCGDVTGGAFLTGVDGDEGLNNQIQVPLTTTDKKGKKKTEIIRRTFAEGKKRTIIITNKQKEYLEEVTSTMSVGGGVDGSVEGGNSYDYVAPLGGKNKFYAPANDRQGILQDPNLMGRR